MNAPPVESIVRDVVGRMEVCDIHTHLFDPSMGDMLLSGIDELLVYHYHVAELFRARPDLDADRFWEMPTPDRADLVWAELFVERTPVSEVGLGVVAMLSALGIDPGARDLAEARAYFHDRSLAQRVDETFRIARVRQACMTNDPLDEVERGAWERGFRRDPRFVAALRLDSAIVDWPAAVPALRGMAYDVTEELCARTLGEVERYLRDWIEQMGARYMAVSLTPSFRYPDPHSTVTRLLENAVIPAARDAGLPVALMIGVRRQVNPRLRLAGDSVGTADVTTIERLAGAHPDVRFMVTFLARENQHQLCVAARKFGNVLPFGCWWFVNQSSLIREITSMRLDLLGPTFVPQHSDARVLEQVIYKWQRSRELIADVLGARYREVVAAGRPVREQDIERDLRRMLGDEALPARVARS